ncbi:carboxypeptidase-like regulatory domain-containing protein [Aquimarina sp. I32.4]|uniref:carboxypeptidase-like regulatory domain-containing protein n=1 Tax=Aquimarina sp. I32.4 TaxID=2053903 RepID=UPI000CDEF9EB|nr:carboxypeptidase-like regulatory domain-containing protein [Aquimarina sp. I32.4]
MQQTNKLFRKKHISFILLVFLVLGFPSKTHVYAYIQDITSNSDYNKYKGIILDKKTNKPLISASISVNQTNISTVTNTEGKFLLKVPADMNTTTITISYLGYRDKTIALSEFEGKELKIKLNVSVTELSEVSITPIDPIQLLKKVMQKKGSNYLNEHTIMTAFYRETIKKRRTYVSLSEAVVDIYKNPYESKKTDVLKLFKARKSADYKKLDTLTLKLQGGPTTTLYIDVMKNSDILFTDNMPNLYSFSFDTSTKINDQDIYVLNFKQHPHIKEPLYFGKLYIDSKSFAVTKAVYSLNMENKEEVSKMFVRKKPKKAKVNLTKVSYAIDYRQKNGKWYYSYGKVNMNVKVNWKKKLFNSLYKLNVEMAVTDWKKNTDNLSIKQRNQLKPSVIISDEASGFSDPVFWGEFNVIEPEKSIESAIKKIKKQLQRLN